MECLQSKVVRVRKPHSCWGCRREIQIGENAEYCACVDAGNFCASYWCEKCQIAMSELDYDDLMYGFTYGELIDSYPELFERLGDGTEIQNP